jgi:hypothetical protein
MVLEKFAKTVPSGLDVVELYGGCGFQTLTLQNLLQPGNHIVVERDKYCTDHLAKEFPAVTVINGKAEENYKVKSDYYSLDSNGWTINTFVTNANKNKEMYEAIFGYEPKAIQFWDSSKSYFMANKELYSEQLGQKVTTFQEYAKALSEFFYRNYNYSASYVCYARYSSYFLLEPGKRDLEEMKTSDVLHGIKGFRWI